MQMNTKCLCCGADYKVEHSDSVFRFQFCTEKCQLKSEEEYVQSERYLCVAPFTVQHIENKSAATVKEGSKWIRQDKKLKGLSQVHLESLDKKNSGFEWLEITNQMLTAYFQKIN